MSVDLQFEAARLRNLGNSYATISRALGVPKTTVHRWLNSPRTGVPATPTPTTLVPAAPPFIPAQAQSSAPRAIQYDPIYPKPLRVFQGSRSLRPAAATPTFIQVESPPQPSLQILPVLVQSPEEPHESQPILDPFTSFLAGKVIQTFNQPTQPVQPNPEIEELKRKLQEDQKRTDELRRVEEDEQRMKAEEQKRAYQEKLVKLGNEVAKAQETIRLSQQKKSAELTETVNTYVRSSEFEQNQVLDAVKRGMKEDDRIWDMGGQREAINFENDRKDNALLLTAFDEVSRKFDETTRPCPSTSPPTDQSRTITPTSQNVPAEDTSWKTAAALGLVSVGLAVSAPFLSKAVAKIVAYLTPPQPSPRPDNIDDAPAKDNIRVF